MTCQKDIPIGEYFTIGNEIYKCVEATDNGDCSYCDFQNAGKYSFTLCDQYACMNVEREDLKEVNFIIYDDTTGDIQQDD